MGSGVDPVRTGTDRCITRDRLFEQYRQQLDEFRRFVDAYVRRDPLVGTLPQVEDARRRVLTMRAEIHRHCRECGCDPDWLERTSAA